MNLTAVEISNEHIRPLVKYWADATPEYLLSLGADITKMPSSEQFTRMLEKQISLPYDQKPAYATIWLLDSEPIGHCNINKIEYGKEAFMHLHIWNPNNRIKGAGTQLVKCSLPFFFENMKLERLICEPYALNPAPNKTLPKIGFEFIKRYKTIPGPINLEQEVNRYVMSRERFRSLF